MVTTSKSTSTAVIAVEPVFPEPERRALAGFLAGYTGLTREAYPLDLRGNRRSPGPVTSAASAELAEAVSGPDSLPPLP